MFEMNKIMVNSSPIPLDLINVGSFYVALIEDTFLRVRVLETTQTDVNCFLIDFGDDVTVNKTKIYPLTQDLAKIQAQVHVVACSYRNRDLLFVPLFFLYRRSFVAWPAWKICTSFPPIPSISLS